MRYTRHRNEKPSAKVIMKPRIARIKKCLLWCGEERGRLPKALSPSPGSINCYRYLATCRSPALPPPPLSLSLSMYLYLSYLSVGAAVGIFSPNLLVMVLLGELPPPLRCCLACLERRRLLRQLFRRLPPTLHLVRPIFDQLHAANRTRAQPGRTAWPGTRTIRGDSANAALLLFVFAACGVLAVSVTGRNTEREAVLWFTVSCRSV